jgi:hypothetical protein
MGLSAHTPWFGDFYPPSGCFVVSGGCRYRGEMLYSLGVGLVLRRWVDRDFDVLAVIVVDCFILQSSPHFLPPILLLLLPSLFLVPFPFLLIPTPSFNFLLLLQSGGYR